MTTQNNPAADQPPQRFELVDKCIGMQVWQEMDEEDEGEWIRYEDHQQAVAALAAQLAQDQARAEWQPIASAPKDGTRIMLWGFIGYEQVIGLFNPAAERPHWCFCGQRMDETYASPTHWMPLPPPPE